MLKTLNLSPIKDGFSKHIDDNKHQSSPSQSVRQNYTNKARELGEMLRRKPGVYTINHMGAAGFKYTGVGDTTRCPDCGLTISGWTIDMIPFKIHSERRPDCTFVRSIKPLNIAANSSSSSSSSSSSIQTNLSRTTSQLNEQEKPSKRQKIETTNETSLSNILIEMKPLKDVRVRTFSHWPHRTSPSKAQMIEAGFYNCNVGDRVICLYCNLICQQWTPHMDDPCEVHKTLRPQCPFVLAMLACREAPSILVANEKLTSNRSPTAAASSKTFRSNEIVRTAACNDAYIESPARHASFATWPNDNFPTVDELVNAGFFYTGSKTIVTCFYCNGKLQDLYPNSNLTIEHARWFPHCEYAKQLCGEDLYQRIQESRQAAQECARANEMEKKNSPCLTVTNMKSASQKLHIPDEITLSRLVAARLELPISRSLLTRNFKLLIIKRCWEDQLRLKQDDFVSDCDMLIACTILQKQIEHINGIEENIIVPSVQMKRIREQSEKERAAAANTTEDSKTKKPATATASEQNQSFGSLPQNPCVLCLSNEKRLACIPCGHLSTCVPCGRSLRSCPICGREIEAFVRIYT